MSCALMTVPAVQWECKVCQLTAASWRRAEAALGSARAASDCQWTAFAALSDCAQCMHVMCTDDSAGCATGFVCHGDVSAPARARTAHSALQLAKAPARTPPKASHSANRTRTVVFSLNHDHDCSLCACRVGAAAENQVSSRRLRQVTAGSSRLPLRCRSRGRLT